MPTQSKNFKFPIAVGTDNYNHLTIDNVAYEAIDNQMFINQTNAVQSCEETKSGTIHALVSTVKTATVYRFVATSDYRSGDTFTMNGVSITARLSNGATLPDYAYRIGNSVLFIQAGGIITFLTPPALSPLDMYPVGSVYQSINPTSPATLFGGTWSPVNDRFLIGSGEKTAGSSGGANSKTIGANNLPQHYHDGLTIDANPVGIADPSSTGYGLQPVSGNLSSRFITTSTGNMGGQALDITPAYYAVNIWVRNA